MRYFVYIDGDQNGGYSFTEFDNEEEAREHYNSVRLSRTQIRVALGEVLAIKEYAEGVNNCGLQI